MPLHLGAHGGQTPRTPSESSEAEAFGGSGRIHTQAVWGLQTGPWAQAPAGLSCMATAAHFQALRE